MLPIVLYETEADVQQILLDTLHASATELGQEYRTVIHTSSAKEAAQALQKERGILLLIAGILKIASDPDKLGIKLCKRAMKQNRDNYAVYCLRNAADLEMLVNFCIRPAGVLSLPVSVGKASNLFKRILTDYSLIREEEIGTALFLQSGATAYRIPHRQLLYVQANNKKLTLFTKRQVITVYESLANLERQLGEAFIKCHRSFLVNTVEIDSVDFSGMQISLRDGTIIPLSRSSRDLLRNLMVPRDQRTVVHAH